MIDTETYLIHLKSDFLRRIAAGFIVCIIVFAMSCVLAYLVAWWGFDDAYMITSPITVNGVVGTVKSAAVSQIPNVIALAVLFASVFTVVNKWIVMLLCLWKGACLGCAAYLMGSGAVRGISGTWAWSLTFYFLAAVAFMVLASVSLVYSQVICRMFAAEEKKYTASIGMEYLKCFLVMSGGVLILGCISVILI